MDSSSSVQIIILVILLFGSGFFSAAETALMSLSKIEVRAMVEQNEKNARLLERLLEDPSKLLGSILVGNNLINIGASSLATMLALSVFENAGAGIATGLMTLFILIFGEITPKSMATQNAKRMAKLVAKPIYLFVTLFNPVVKILMFVTNGIIKLLGGDPDKTKPFITADELKTIVTVSHEEGVLLEEEKQMIYNVFDFGNSCAKDIMIPRTDMIAIDVTTTYDEILDLYKTEKFSRFPVYEESPDHIIGILCIKDLILKDAQKGSFNLKSFLREAYFVHEFKSNDELFKEMRTHKLGIAIVLDEYGGTAGLVTMEDLIEEIVGDIADEYDQIDEDFIKIGEKEYVVDGTARISEVNEELGLHIISEDFDSIGGFVIGLFDRFPKESEEIIYKNITFIIEETINNRINSLRILINSEKAVASGE